MRLLLVSYYFPPLGLSGVLRPLKFTKYLSRLGWDVRVLTSYPARYYAFDRSLLGELPAAVRIQRTPSLDVFHLGRGPVPTDTTALPGFRTRWLSRMIFLPDSKIGWYPYAASGGKKSALHERPDVIVATAPPFTAFLVGRRLALSLRVPLVLDYRDSWLMDPHNLPPTPLHRWIASLLESKAVKAASAIITVNERLTGEIAERYPEARERVTTIYNGFDPEDFTELPRVSSPFRRSAGLQILYMGTLSRDANRPRVFFEALSLLMDEVRATPPPLEIVFMGVTDEPSKSLASELGIGDLVRFVPYAPHREALACLSMADALLLIVDPHAFADRIVTGKLFEYLGAGKPVIALAPADSEAARIVRATGAGIVLPPDDPHAVLGGIRQWMREREGGRDLPRARAGSLSLYDRREQAAVLDRILRKLIRRYTRR